MLIQFISQSIENVPTQKGSYDKMMVTFKNVASKKVEVKTILSFAVPKDVWERLVSAQKDEVFNVTTEKDAKGYWQWTEVARSTDPIPETETPKVAVAGKVNTYDEKNKLDRERFEFDKTKQELIIRQSCLSSAVELCKDHGKQPSVDQVITVAMQFETWVWGRGVAALTDDIPE